MSLDEITRSVMDLILGIPGNTSFNLNPYTVSIVQVTNTGGVRPAVGGTRHKTVTPLKSASNGNFRVQRVSSKDIALSGNTLKDTDLVIGPVVFPYTTANGSTNPGGFDFNFFDPASNGQPNNNSYQLYFLITGPDLSVNGNYFEKIYSEADSPLSYKIYVRNLGVTLP